MRLTCTAAAYARREVGAALLRGALTRQSCEACGRAATHAHHDDYSKPLAVRWLCHSHHALWHARNGAGANRDTVVRLAERSKRCVECRAHGHSRNSCPQRKVA